MMDIVSSLSHQELSALVFRRFNSPHTLKRSKNAKPLRLSVK